MAEPTLHRVELTLCSLCLDGAGGECHVPGCALWINRAPDLSLRANVFVSKIDGLELCYECFDRISPRLKHVCQPCLNKRLVTGVKP